MLKTLMATVRARMLMIFLDLAAILSMFIQDYHLSFVPLFTGRFILGIIIGINSGLIPQYILAITPKTLIGSVGCLHQAMLTVGITFGYGLGFTVDS
jgi:MFS family permease